MVVDWSLLPKDLLERVGNCLETCFEIVHYRSVCGSWRSAVPPLSNGHGLGVNSLLPVFDHDPLFESGDTHCELRKIPVFLLIFQTPFGAEYLLVGISKSKSGKHKLLVPITDTSLSSPHGIVLNTLSCQIIPLGHYYKIKFCTITTRRHSHSIRVAFLPLDGEDFLIVARVFEDSMMYRSYDKRWIKLEGRFKSYRDMVIFKGKFYVVDMSGKGHVFVIEPSLEVSEIISVTQSHKCADERLVVSGDELLLVQRFTPGEHCDEYMHTWFRLYRLEEKGQRRWVRINDLEDRVVFLGYDYDYKLCYSTKEFPGMKPNYVMFDPPNTDFESILVYDLGTKRTRKTSEYRGCIVGHSLQSQILCGIVALLDPTISIYESSYESE